MRVFSYKVLLVAVVLVVTSLFIPSHHNMAAADFKKNNTQGGHGCVGLHCLVADDFAADLFMDLHGPSRNLLANTDTGSGRALNPGPSCDGKGKYGDATGCPLRRSSKVMGKGDNCEPLFRGDKSPYCSG